MFVKQFKKKQINKSLPITIHLRIENEVNKHNV